MLFMAWTVFTSHYPALFVGGFLFFLGFVKATSPYQSRIDLRSPLLVGFFLAGLVVHGGLQGWWIAPVLASLSDLPLFLGATLLTAVNDNALITYLATLVPESQRTAEDRRRRRRGHRRRAHGHRQCAQSSRPGAPLSILRRRDCAAGSAARRVVPDAGCPAGVPRSLRRQARRTRTLHQSTDAFATSRCGRRGSIWTGRGPGSSCFEAGHTRSRLRVQPLRCRHDAPFWRFQCRLLRRK